MASLLERIQNVFDNHQDLDRERVRQDGHHQAHDALLGSAVTLKDDWSQELARSRSESHAGVHARYEARIQGLNDAFSVLRQSEPGITTQLNADEFRESAVRQTKARTYGGPELQHSPYQYAYAATRQRLDMDFAHRETDRAKQQFIDDVAVSAQRHLAFRYPTEDREAGVRQATVDWAHQHKPELLLARGAERPILDHDQYRAGYDAMKEALDRKLDAWHGTARDSQVVSSKDTERQAVHDLALQAPRRSRELG
jgi:hypothetical protein